jgi:hypothetical protein
MAITLVNVSAVRCIRGNKYFSLRASSIDPKGPLEPSLALVSVAHDYELTKHADWQVQNQRQAANTIIMGI